MRKFTILAASAALAVGMSGPAMADDGAKDDVAKKDGATETPYAEFLYGKMCSGCHGPNGQGDDQMQIPKIAGREASFIEEQALGIKGGKRMTGDSKWMKRAIAEDTDDEIRAIAKWLETKK